MKTLQIKSETEYFAKKRVIQEALKFFRKEHKQTAVKIISYAKQSDEDISKPITFTKVLKRSAFTSAIGYQSIPMDWNKIVTDTELGKKSTIIALFDKL